MDNEWMQYRMNINKATDFRGYWEKPYSVKPEMGFYSWSKDKIKLRAVDDIEEKIPKYFEQIILNFFSQDTNVKRFVELISLENKKKAKIFSVWTKPISFASYLKLLEHNFFISSCHI